MANATETQLQELYVAYFGRPADPLGLDYWFEQGVLTKDFAANMYLQPEFNYVIANLNVANQVNQIYRNLFNRDADAEGLSYWVEEINSGSLQLASIANDLIYNVKATGGNADDLAALNNRSAAAIAYTAEVKSSSTCILAYQPESKDPWINGRAFVEAKNYMQGIDKDTMHCLCDINICHGFIEPYI